MNYINARSLGGRRITEPQRKIDNEVSKIVGKNISTTDPRLLSFLADKRKELGEEASLSHALRSDSIREELKNKLK